MVIATFRDLKVWHKAHGLVLDIYRITKTFPVEEKYGLVSQIRRSATSIPTNIVEGFNRKSKKDYAHFINIANGSLEETKYHILLSKDLGYLAEDDFNALGNGCDEIGKMLYGFYQRLSLSAFAEYHGFLSRARLSADRDECGKKPWRYGGFRRGNVSADNPDEYGKIVEENFAISYESG